MICVSLDCTSTKELLHLADLLGPYVDYVKTHVDILQDFNYPSMLKLKDLSRLHSFKIIEDRKFADIGNTVRLQLDGIFRIREWADFVTCHAICGEPMLDVFNHLDIGVFLILDLSCKGNLTQSIRAQAASFSHPSIVGYIAQQRTPDMQNKLLATPGISLNASSDSLGQQYSHPLNAIQNGANILIIGRDIINAKDPVERVKEYRALLQHTP